MNYSGMEYVPDEILLDKCEPGVPGIFDENNEWQHKQLDWACSALLDVAFQRCCCRRKDLGYICHICKARDVLTKRFPGELPYRIRADVLAGSTLTDELAS